MKIRRTFIYLNGGVKLDGYMTQEEIRLMEDAMFDGRRRLVLHTTSNPKRWNDNTTIIASDTISAYHASDPFEAE